MCSRALVLSFAMAVSGCSLFAVRGESTATEPCTTSYVLPVIDAVLGAAGFVTVGYVLIHQYTDSTPSSPEAIGRIAVGVPAGVLGTTYVISALVGRVRVSRCRAAAASR